MKIPFTVDQFLEIFKNYNLSVWPMQIIFYLLVVVIIILALKRIPHSSVIISLILAFFWLWMGVVYNLIFFTSINKAAYAFGAVFILQGILFFVYGILLKKISFRFQSDLYGTAGGFIMLFAVVVYPLLSILAGHKYPFAPTLGLPCPTTIFTFGLLLWTEKKIPVMILVIPFVWSVIGFSAAIFLGIYEDTGLLISGLLATILLLIRNRKISKGMLV